MVNGKFTETYEAAREGLMVAQVTSDLDEPQHQHRRPKKNDPILPPPPFSAPMFCDESIINSSISRNELLHAFTTSDLQNLNTSVDSCLLESNNLNLSTISEFNSSEPRYLLVTTADKEIQTDFSTDMEQGNDLIMLHIKTVSKLLYLLFP